jgi:hypothetical protein
MTAEWPTLHHLSYAARVLKPAAAMAPNKTNLGYPPELEFAIQEQLSVLGSIEARYTDELRLRQQLESRRKSAREPHVLKLAELRQRLLAETLWRGGTRH